MKIVLGKTEASMINPPLDGTVEINGIDWRIGRTGSGNIMLRRPSAPLNPAEPHPEFLPDGMDLQTFVWWINDKL